MPVCTKCGQENPDVARFCLACGSPLAQSAAPVEERKLVTVVFTDIVGSTSTAEALDPEDVRARLKPYSARVRAELERFGGTVEKFIGDAVVALFGAPVAHEDDPERAVRAALAVRSAIDRLNEEDEWLDLKIRVGVNTGEALVVVGARAVEGEGMAAGDVMNTAARLQSAAPVNGIVVAETTYDATRDCIEYQALEPISANGKREPVPVWQAVRALDELERPARGALVGRDDELATLARVWEDVAVSREPFLVTVLGSPGIGKSRLVEELAARAGANAQVHWGRCLSYGDGITYWPVAEVLKSIAGLQQSDDSEAAAAKLGALLERLGTDDPDALRTMAAAAANVLGTETTPRGTYSAVVIAQAELHWGIRKILQLLAREAPLMLVVEDLHWAEPTLCDLLFFLLARDVEAPLLLVATARPELVDQDVRFAQSGERSRVLSLEALPADAGSALLAELLGDTALDDSVRDRMLLNAGGNPLFLEETVRMMVDRAAQSAADDELPVPTTLQALIAARLDQLPIEDKRIGQHAAVIGRVFWRGALAHVAERDDESALRDSLVGLERRDVVHRQALSSVAGDSEYAFKHILIRDVAYGQLPKGRRAELHVRFADWVGTLPRVQEDFLEIVAWHLEQSCRLAGEIAHSPIDPPVLDAAAALARAAERAERREGLREAKRFYERALEVLGDAHLERSLELRLQHGRILGGLGELEAACGELDACADAAAQHQRSDVRCEALVILANIDQRQGRVGDARTRLDEALPLAAAVADPRLRIRARFSHAALLADFEADVPAALDELREALALAERAEERALAVEGHLRMGYILFNTGDFTASEAELTRCYELAEGLGSRRDQARATFPLALIKYYRGKPDEALRLGEQARDWLERTGEPFFQLQNLRALGMYALARQDFARAERLFQEAIPIALREAGRFAYEIYRWLTETLVREDRVEDARVLLDFAARGATAEDEFMRAYVSVIRALVAAAEGDVHTVRADYERALEIFDKRAMPIELAETQISFARALRRLGDTEGASTQLELARETFERMGADGVLRLLDQEFATMARGAGYGPARSARG